MEEVKVLLIGLGNYGKLYLDELTTEDIPDVRLVGVCSAIPSVTEKFPVIEEKNIPLYKTPEEFYAGNTADLAVISSAIYKHYAQIRTCLENGSCVLCEKPPCTSVKEAEELIELEERYRLFVAVGYQLNYSGDVLELKQDIIDEMFGKPVLMKAVSGLRRGKTYYGRNNWSGKITVDGITLNDSPFNNACAHQFQNMTFLLGRYLDSAADISEVEGELYRASKYSENFDTAAVRAVTDGGVPIFYYTSLAIKDEELGPLCEYRFEDATVYFGKDFGDGPVNEYVAVFNDGSTFSYENVPKGPYLQKLYDAIECVRSGWHPVSTLECSIPHLFTVEALAGEPVEQIEEERLGYMEEDGDEICYIKDIEEIFKECFEAECLPRELNKLKDK